MLAHVHHYSLKWRLTFNEKKTVVLTLGEERHNASAIMNRKWQIGGKTIAEKDVWHNLGKTGTRTLTASFQFSRPPKEVRLSV